MSLPSAELVLGPVRCAWRAHCHSTRAEPAVRDWLADSLRTHADAVPLVRSAHGRPGLGAPYERADVSWSHSGDGLLMALGGDVRLGVDLEQLRPRPRALALARRFFTPGEAACLDALEGPVREHAFTRLWCAKEAVLKAHGRGLSFGLHRLQFVADGEQWRLVDCDPALGAPDDWTLHPFAPAAGYVAALAWRPRR